MPNTEAIVAVSDHGLDAPRKVVRVVGHMDGSLSVMVPYHPVRDGKLVKVRIPSTLGATGRGRGPIVETLVTDSPVKLSIHASGFVQFSAAGRKPIRSGRDPKWHQAKGLGYRGHSLTDHAISGPTFGVYFHKLTECSPVDGTEKGRVITFGESDLFERDPHQPNLRHIYAVNGSSFRARC